jgi:iron uptake system component EfeO
MARLWHALLVGPCLLGGCSGSSPAPPPKTDAEYRAEVASETHDALLVDIQTLVAAAKDIQAYAPIPPDRGWDASLDASALGTMKGALDRARGAYERIEGAVELSYPMLDFALDSRYEDYLRNLGPAGDPYLFDDQGVVGMDGIERILYANVTPAGVVAYERTLPGYVAASFPTTAVEAADFKNKLATRLVNDATTLETSWASDSFDADTGFFGLIGIVQEQEVEIEQAPQNAEESRYSQHTMDDLRANVEGTEATYGIFRPWLLSKTGGGDADAKVTSGILALEQLYEGVPGDALPPVPSTWNAQTPSASDLASAYGQLYQGVVGAVDPTATEMSGASTLLGLTRK